MAEDTMKEECSVLCNPVQPPYLRAWFKEQRLCVVAQGCVAVFVGWPHMRAWFKRFGQEWHPFRPPLDVRRKILLWQPMRAKEPAPFGGPFRLKRPRHYSKVQPEVEKFLTEQIPSRIRGVVSGFPHRNWHLVVFAARCGDAGLDLIKSNPALAFMLASAHVFLRTQRAVRWDRIRRLLRRKQREIGAALGLPDEEVVAKVLRKVRPEACSISAFLYLSDILRDKDRTLLCSHLPNVNTSVILSLTHPVLRTMTTPRLLCQLSLADGDSGTVIDPLGQLLRAIRGPHQHRLEIYQRLDSIEQVTRLVRDYEAVRNHPRNVHVNVPFHTALGQPPLEGTQDIVPLKNVDELCTEGNLMNHCVASYAHDVLEGRCYVYRILAPRRATLMVASRYGEWVVEELRGPSNHRVQLATRNAVYEWLAKAQSPTATDSRPNGLQVEFPFPPESLADRRPWPFSLRGTLRVAIDLLEAWFMGSTRPPEIGQNGVGPSKAANFVLDSVLAQRRRVAYYTFSQSAAIAMLQLITLQAGIDLARRQPLWFTEADFLQLTRSARRLASQPLIVQDAISLNGMDIAEHCREVTHDGRIELIVLETPNHVLPGTDARAEGSMSREAKRQALARIAAACGVPVLSLTTGPAG